MQIAAPAYLAELNTNTAPPGHRFGLYFPYWKAPGWVADDHGKAKAIGQTLSLPPSSVVQTEALRKRQNFMLDAMNQAGALRIEARSIAPLATGLGIEHPIENGFAFLSPYGLPYLPGSSIKGVLRRAVKELIGEAEKDADGSTLVILFGSEDSDEPSRGVLTFWDSIPELAGNTLGVDVMTPHYSKYYQGDQSPHDAGSPNPIPFMVIPPNSEFSFCVTCDIARLPDGLAADDRWKRLLQDAFEHAFDWLGFGAKTSVGYGAMKRDTDAEKKREDERKAAERDKQKAAMSEEQRQIMALRELYEDTKKRGELKPGCSVSEHRGKLLNEALEWAEPEYRKEAAELLARIAKDLAWAKKKKQEAKEKMARLRE